MLKNRKPKPKYLVETKADKQLRRVLISMIGSIAVCMACLVGSTWAWFQTTITSEGNTITIGEMKVSVSLDKGEKGSRSTLTPSGKYEYELDEVGTYNILLMNTGDIPGYCTIRLTDAQGNSEKFTSGTLYPAEDGLEDAATITIEITSEDNFNDILPVTLEIEPHWGEDPNSAIMDIDEELFVPTEETTEAAEEEPLEDEDPENLTPVEPEEPNQPTEPTQGSEPEAPPADTEDTGTPDGSGPTEPAEPPVTTAPTEGTTATDPTETEPEGSSEPTTDPTETKPENPTEESKAE